MKSLSAWWGSLPTGFRAGWFLAQTVFWMGLASLVPGPFTVPLAVGVAFTQGLCFKIVLDEMKRP